MRRLILLSCMLASVLCVGSVEAQAQAPAGVASAITPPKGAVRELESRRTASSSTWLMPSGEHATKVSAAPLRWKDARGAWRDYDLSITPTSSASFVAKSGPIDFRFAQATGSKELPDVAVSVGDDRIGWTLEGASAAEAKVDGSTITYPQVVKSVDMRATVTETGLKEDLILRGIDAGAQFDYRLTLSRGIEPRLAHGGRELELLRDGTVAYSLFTGPLTDAKGALGPQPAMQLERVAEGGWRVRVSADEKWLGDADRAWPVTLDPSFTTTALQSSVACVVADRGTTIDYTTRISFCNSDMSVQSGTGSGSYHYRSHLKFDLAAALGTDHVVSSARLVLYIQGASAGAGPLNVARADANNWNNTFSLTPSGNWLALPPTTPAPVADSPYNVDLTWTTGQWQERRSDPSAGRPNFGLLISGKEFGWGSNLDGAANPGCPGSPCTNEYTFIEGPTEADAWKRPYLSIVSMPKAPAGSAVVSPKEGQLSARRVVLKADVANSTVSSVRFQYVMGDERDWQDVPASALQYHDVQPGGGTTVASSEIPASAGSSIPVIWDIQKTAGGQLDGAVHVRAVLDDPSSIGGGVTAVTNFVLDRTNIEKVATATVGPGTVNLLSGDFTLQSSDAHVDAVSNDLDLKRTYHSRGTTPRTAGMFGPGWTSGIEVAGGEMPYRGLTSYSEIDEQYVTNWIGHETLNQIAIPTDVGCICISIWGWEYYPVTETLRWEYQYTTLELNDGGKITFSQRLDPSGQPSGWKPDADHPGMELEKTAATWVVTDTKGNKTTFSQDATGAPTYLPTAFQEVGTTLPLEYTYALVNGVKRLTRVTAPGLAGVANPEREERYLRLVWSDVTTPEGPSPRVTGVKFGRWDSSQSAIAEIDVASYTYDSVGRLQTASDPQVAGGLPETYAYDSTGRMTTYTPAGEAAWTMVYAAAAGDDNAGRLASATRQHPSLGAATWSVRYDVPVSGTGAPYDLSRAATATWGEVDDLPVDATAIFPPKQVPAAQPASWQRATIHYMDLRGKAVNVAAPGGAIATKQHDANGNVQAELTAENRGRALAASNTADTARSLMTIHRYATNGVDETETLGPRHAVTLKDGSVVQARTQTLSNHDYGSAPNPNFDYHLVTATIVAAKLDNGDRRDISTTTYGYENPDGTPRGWNLRKPTKTVIDAGTGAANLTKWTIYDATSPLIRRTRAPKSTGAGSHETQYWYYGADSAEPGCGASGRAGLLCKRATPVGPSTPPKPIHTYAYNAAWQETQHVETVGSTTRTTTKAYDGDDRLTSTSVATSPSTDNVLVTRGYSSTTGDLTTTTTAAAGSEPARTITRSYDTNGRLSTYQDADGATTTYAYDLNGNELSKSDSKATATLTYDIRDLPISLLDTSIGSAITATYDADGEIASQSLPNGLTKSITRDSTGEATDQTYVKAPCASNCTWAESHINRDLAGRSVKETAGTRTREFEYDGPGRLIVVKDRISGQCTTRVYDYDANSNRTSRRTYVPATGGACSQSTSVTSVPLSYDEADRINSSGFATDALGRETQVPSSAIGTALNATFYANDRTQTLTQASTTHTYRYDAQSRIRQRVTTGGNTEIRHYGDESDMTSWTGIGSSWERAIGGLDGQVAAVRETDGSIIYLLNDLHGDAVVAASSSAGATAPIATLRYDEFGVPASGVPRRGWLAGADRTSELPSGVIAMGARTYVPGLGRFLQPDPIDGAPNPYDYALQDPINNYDLEGTCLPVCIIAIPIGIEAAIAISVAVTGGVVTAIIVQDLAEGYDFSIPVVNGINWDSPFTFSKDRGSNKDGSDPAYRWTEDRLKAEYDKATGKRRKTLDGIMKRRKMKNQQKRNGN